MKVKYDRNFFVYQPFQEEELARYKQIVARDLEIAKTANHPEVMFHFAYMALLKIGVYLLAREGHRVKSRPGHHQKIIQTMGEILHNEDVTVIGEKMRKDRNADLYSAGMTASPEEVAEYLKFIDVLFRRIY